MKIKILLMSLSLILFTGCSFFSDSANIAVVDTRSFEDITQRTQNVDERGNAGIVSVFGDLVQGKRVPYILAQFQYNIADYDVSVDVVDTGSVIQNNSEAVISTGTGLNAEVRLESVDSLPYIPGNEGYALFTAAFSNGGVDGVVQEVGLFNEGQDGYFLGYNNTNFQVGLFKDGVKKGYNRDTFLDPLNGSGASGCDLDFTNLIVYRISYGWLGIAHINFEVLCNSEVGFVTFARIDLANSQDTPSINNPVLPINFNIVKNNVAQDIKILTASWNGGIIDGGLGGNRVSPSSRIFSHTNDKTINAGVLTNIITINSTETYFGKVNRINTVLNYLSMSSLGNKPVTIYIFRNCDVAGTQNWNNENVNNSVMSWDLDGTTLTNCEEITTIQLAKEDSKTEKLEDLNIEIRAGETISIGAISSQVSAIRVSLTWRELF